MVLTTPEIRKLIRAHNVLMSIKIPVGSKKADIIKIVEANGYEIDHEKKAIIPKVEMKRRPVVDMKKAAAVLPKPKTKEERATAKAKTDKKKSMKEKDLKQEGFKSGAALQRAVSKRQARKKKEPAPAKKSAPLLLGDKAPAPPEAPAPFKKALRTRLNKDFKKKYDKNIWDALEMDSTSTPSPAQVKKVCRKLQLKNHPDKGGDEEVFKSIREACEIYVETFKEGDDEEAEFEIPVAMTERQKSAISSFIKLYSASAIKKLDTIKKVEDAFSDGQDLYNSIQQRFTKPNQMRMKKLPEMREWFDNNMSAGKYKEYTDTQKLLKRRINAQAKKVR